MINCEVAPWVLEEALAAIHVVGLDARLGETPDELPGEILLSVRVLAAILFLSSATRDGVLVLSHCAAQELVSIPFAAVTRFAEALPIAIRSAVAAVQ